MHILLQNCKNVEEHTHINHNINYVPLDSLVQQMVTAITTKGVNPIEELVDAMSEGESKLLVKAMLKAVQEDYTMGRTHYLLNLH